LTMTLLTARAGAWTSSIIRLYSSLLQARKEVLEKPLRYFHDHGGDYVLEARDRELELDVPRPVEILPEFLEDFFTGLEQGAIEAYE